ncbi:MAG: LysR family transcriptional regulator [Devosia sp.]|uniref:LysR family transcriptional regulator n=1 Tax=Devosia sp. TaxID=1871048 RepID=UPI001A523C51|nr:LysR family transcriptional regulator [Devosia sp.]MBL8596800.1 LysR family transcriptional regulator [Devosia sp.]
MADLDALETFTRAVRTGSFAAAARVLGITPAMVGRRIQGLEQRYGARLIERTTRAQRLTEAGETFLRHAETVLDAAAELEDSMRAAPGRLEGRIRMTGPATLGVFSLAGIVARFQAANPAVTVEMILSDRRMDLIADGLGLAVRIGELQSSSMIARRVGTYRLMLVASPDYLERHGAPAAPGELTAARCLINLNMSPRNRWPLSRGGRQEVAEVEGGLQIDNGEALRVATLEGAGIAYLPTDLVRADVAAGRLVPILADWQMLTLPIHLIHPSRRVPRRVAVLLEILAEELGRSHPS